MRDFLCILYILIVTRDTVVLRLHFWSDLYRRPQLLTHTAFVIDGWMGIWNWWNGTDRGNWSTGRETLYSVGGRWMNVYGALVEWYWQGKTEVLGKKKSCYSGTLSTTNPHGLAWDGTLASAVKGYRLTDWDSLILQFVVIIYKISPTAQ